jgi:hypothetical protein
MSLRSDNSLLTGNGMKDDHGMEPAGSAEWSHAALFACVTHLQTSLTEGRSVEVLAAWVDDGGALCVVYQYPYYMGVLGLRRAVDTDMYGEPVSDPESFGRDVADFDIGEPLGSTADWVRPDHQGVSWWGDQHDEPPGLTDSQRLLGVIAAANAEHALRRAEREALPRVGHLARRSDGSHEWMLSVPVHGESVLISEAEASLPEDVLLERFRLVSLHRGGYWQVRFGDDPGYVADT